MGERSTESPTAGPRDSANLLRSPEAEGGRLFSDVHPRVPMTQVSQTRGLREATKEAQGLLPQKPRYLIITEFGLRDHDYYGFWGLSP